MKLLLAVIVALVIGFAATGYVLGIWQTTFRVAPAGLSGAFGELGDVDIAVIPAISGGRKVEFENSSTRFNRTPTNIDVSENEPTKHGYASWKLGPADPGKPVVVRVEVEKGAGSSAAMMVAIRFLTAQASFDHECIFSPKDGSKLARGRAQPDAITVVDKIATWIFSCKGMPPAEPTELRINLAPAVGLSVGSLDPAATGNVVLRSISID
jgi:hypothetical protein